MCTVVDAGRKEIKISKKNYFLLTDRVNTVFHKKSLRTDFLTEAIGTQELSELVLDLVLKIRI